MSIKTKRKAKGYSQNEISDILGIPLRTYKRYELTEKSKKTYKHDLLEKKIDDLPNNVIRKKIKRETIAIVGAGNVGYPMGLLLSELNKIIFIDSDKEKVEKINKGVLICEDKDISDYVAAKNPKVKAYSDKKYLNTCDSIILCLPTNYCEETGELNTKLTEEYLYYISENNPSATIVIKSTLPIGFTDKMAKKYKNLEIIFAPEFLREGHSIYDSQYPARMIFGVQRINLKNKRMAMVLENMVLNASKTIFMSYEEAEAVKLFSNTYLAMRIAYVNELDTFASKHNLDTEKIIQGMCMDPRIGNFYNNPSFGFGGHCLPKDSKQLARSLDGSSALINAITESNNNRAKDIAKDIIKRCNGKESYIGFYDTKTKNSSSLSVARELEKESYNVVFFEPSDGDEKAFEAFIEKCDVVVVNRLDNRISKYKEKVYTRDLFAI